jgi:hypothetical protein
MNDDKLLKILDDGHAVLDNLTASLELIVDNKNGPLWHSKNRQIVENAVARLKLLDQEWQTAKSKHEVIASVDQRHQLIRQKITRVQQLISQYMILLEGSKSLVKGEIGRINKAKSIKGYRFKNCYRISSGQLC